MPTYISDETTGSHALDIASARGLLPSELDTVEMRRQIAADIRRNAVFSARTTNARYLQALKERIARLLAGGRDNDWAQLRLELRKELQRLGYTPARGFRGDKALDIPPAEPGSLRDLSSDLRLNLILDTQQKLMRGASQKARGTDGSRLRQFPAWELVRLFPRRVPRGSADSGSQGWAARFIEAGAQLHDGRMIALKTDPVWAALGDSAIFSDALDTDHPPFAFNSGMGWREIHHTDLPESLRAIEQIRSPERPTIDPPRASAAGLDPETLASLKTFVAGLEERDGVLTMDAILKGGRP